MEFTTLISTADLRQNLDNPNWVIVDCRYSLDDARLGRSQYERSHIPGAVHASLDADLSSPVVEGFSGRHPLPAIDLAQAKFSAWGIDSSVQVVAYDDLAGGGLASAARLWWLLRWLGHPRVAVLDGGWKHWQIHLPVRSGEEQPTQHHFQARVRPELIANAALVERAVTDPAYRLLDSRSLDRYRGENESIDPVAGHIPGAISAPYMDNLAEDGRFLSKEVLRERFDRLINGVPPEKVIFYCGSGVTAPYNLLAFAHAGLGEARLYVGSWSEWINDPTHPVATGMEEPG